MIGDEIFNLEGAGIMKYDDTLTGTLIFDPANVPGTPNLTNARHFWQSGDDLYIRTSSNADGYDIYKYDTATGVLTDQNAAQQGVDSLYLSGSFATRRGDTQFFAEFDDGIHGEELWVHDNATGTWSMVMDIYPGSSDGSYNPSRAAYIGDLLIFNAEDGTADADEVWVSDGTGAGTFKLTGTGTAIGPISNAQSFFSTGSEVYFKANTPAYGFVNIITDGTLAGTRIFDLDSGIYSFPYVMLGTDANGMYYTSNAFDGSALYYTDGTAGGTGIVANPTPDVIDAGSRLNFLSHVTLEAENIPVQVQTGSPADELLTGTALRDDIDGGGGRDTIDGGALADTVNYGSATAGVSVYLQWGQGQGGPEKDTLISIENITGSDFGDRLVGSTGPNEIRGGAGDDLIRSNGGDDLLMGEAGNDTIIGNTGAEDIHGGSENDFVSGAKGDDTISGGAGDDSLKGNGEDDLIDGDSGDDKLNGGRGNDTLNGGEDSDRLFGEKGYDVLNGDAGDDYLYGNEGNDTLNGGAGDDRLFGGAEADTFVMTPAGGSDHIDDWANGTDLIDLSAFGFADYADVEALLVQVGSGVNIAFATGELLFIKGALDTDFDAGDFIL